MTSTAANKEKAIQQIKKLLALGDSATFDGEIAAAVTMAGKMMDEHHIEQAEIDAASMDEPRSPDKESFNQVTAACRRKTLRTWEIQLSEAIRDLIGSVKSYRNTDKVVRLKGTFQKKTFHAGITFYGPAEDAQIAADLFEEWVAVIATLGLKKYGGTFKGDGAMYAMGFTESLADKAAEIAKARREIITPSTTALVPTSGGTLSDVLEKKKSDASQWLANVAGVRLSPAGSRTSYNGSAEAKAEGRADGSRADFAVRRSPKLN